MTYAELTELLVAEAQTLVDKQRHGRQRRLVLGRAVRLSALGEKVPELCKRIADEVEQGTYCVGSVEPRLAMIEGKQRRLYQASLPDFLLAAAIGRHLTRRLERTVSPRVYSYRRGVSSWEAVADFGAFVRAHRLARPDPRTRGLYVVRRDVKAYGDNIPVDDASSLWPALEASLEGVLPIASLLRGLLRPRLAGSAERVTSVPTGSPLQPPVCNLYLAPVDAVGAEHATGFYARYGDDILFAHHDAAIGRDVASRIDATLTDLRLTLSQEKCSNLYFNGAGRPGSGWPEARGTTYLTYLGATLGFHGSVSLKRDKARALTRGISRRVQHALKLLPGSVRERTAIAVAVTNAALDPSHPLRDRSASLLASLVTDRGSLRDLDYRVALGIAQQVSGVHGVRAFRRVPYRTLRGQQGLLSLMRRRDRVRSERR